MALRDSLDNVLEVTEVTTELCAAVVTMPVVEVLGTWVMTEGEEEEEEREEEGGV